MQQLVKELVLDLLDGKYKALLLWTSQEEAWALEVINEKREAGNERANKATLLNGVLSIND